MLPRPMFEQRRRSAWPDPARPSIEFAGAVAGNRNPQRVPQPAKSKLDALVLVQFAGLLLDNVFGGLLPLRFHLVRVGWRARRVGASGGTDCWPEMGGTGV